VEGWPHLVQLAWGIYNRPGDLLNLSSHIIRPDGFTIPAEATAIHGISHSRASDEGEDLERVLDEFANVLKSPSITLVAHNLDFDCGVVGAEFFRLNKNSRLLELPAVCTMKTTAAVCRLPRPHGPGFKWPTLEELHLHLFARSYEHPHDAASDLQACARCFFRLVRDGHYRLP
jgi:DNA polymerase III epsilon subunit-like protein